MRYLYASYKKGGFEDVFPEGLSVSEADAMLRQYFSTVFNPHIIFTTKPIGIASYVDTDPWLRVSGYVPHVHWFKWATPREILAGTAKIILEAKKPLFIWSEKKHKGFYEHVMRYGLLKRAGTLEKFDDGHDVPIFHSIVKVTDG